MPSPTPTGGTEVVRKDIDQSWVAVPVSDLPLGETVTLEVEPGVVATKGTEPSVEAKTVTTLVTIPKFSFIGVRCIDNSSEEILVTPASPAGAKSGKCNPLEPVSLVFSSPVMKDALSSHVNFVPDLAGGRTDYRPWETVSTYSSLRQAREEASDYWINIPFGLRANHRYELSAPAGVIKDEFGRVLDTPIHMSFETDNREPKMVLDDTIATLEKAVVTHLPVAITNLDSLDLAYQTLSAVGVGNATLKNILVDKPANLAYWFPVKVRDLLSGKSGAIKGILKPNPENSDEANARLFFAQVTPWAVHFKYGHFNSLAWVTDMTTGAPVTDAKVELYSEPARSFQSSSRVLSDAMTNADGAAKLKGTDAIDPDLARQMYWPGTDDSDKELLFVRVTKGDDIAVIPLVSALETYARGPGDSYISQYERKQYGHLRAWGTTPQGVYKLGNTIDFKIYVRHQDAASLIEPPPGPYTLTVIDPLGKEIHKKTDIKLSAFGAFDGSFVVPASGVVGYYRFNLTGESLNDLTLEPLGVLVSDFTPAPFRVTTDLSGKAFRPEDKVKVRASAALHAGGPYADAPAKISAKIQSRELPAFTGTLTGFYFATSTRNSEESIFDVAGKVDATGVLEREFSLTSAAIPFGKLSVESTVDDDRGRSIAGRTEAEFRGRDRYVGLRSKEWLIEKGKPSTIDVAVIDESFKAVAGTEVAVDVTYTRIKASRVKGPGNAYVTNYEKEQVAVTSCKVVSAAEPVPCTFTPPEPGSYAIKAAIKDTKGRYHSTRLDKWAVGAGDLVWEESPGNTLDIAPEKTDYTVGDVARFLVKNPFPGAVALITTERYGVISSRITAFRQNTEVVEVPITRDLIPGFYLSVVVHSPRADKPIDENQVDLGKPAFRMGYVEVTVKDAAKELVVEAKSREAVYKPRSKVTLDLKVTPKSPSNEPVELAVAVLDEAVFDLIHAGRSYFDPYKGLYSLDSLDLRNYNLLMDIVGRRKYEKKGANSGGDGGKLDMRNITKYVSYWNPSIPAKFGETTTVTFDAPDNLTGWRVLAIAATKRDLLGLGEGTFKVNQDVEIRPALPNRAVEGDAFTASFTVMNRTESPKKLQVTVTVDGPIDSSRETKSEIDAKPFERVAVSVPVKTTKDGTISFAVKATDGQAGDALAASMNIEKRAVLETAAVYGSSIDAKVTERISIPSDIRTDVGTIGAVLSPSVISGIQGAFAYLRDYPYGCWEQRLSKAVMASNYQRLKAYLPADFTWQGSEHLAQSMVDSAAQYQAPNGGMAFFKPEDEYADPYLSAYTAVAFAWLEKDGVKISQDVREKLDAYLIELLRKDVHPSFYSKGMASTVRAVALYALAQRGKVTAEDVTRHVSSFKTMNLFGRSFLLMASAVTNGDSGKEKVILQSIFAAANEAGGKFVFSESVDDGYKRILASPMRDNCAILSAFLLLKDKNRQAELVGDKPFKMVRTITQTRQGRDYWENTQENLFCMRALAEFSAVYEKDTPQMTVSVAISGNGIGTAAFADVRDPAKEVVRSIEQSDLGKKSELVFEKSGTGRFYYSARLTSAKKEPNSSPKNAGLEVKRQYSVQRNGAWILLKDTKDFKQGDLLRVDLYLDVPAARNFVVVSDPVPGGVEPVNRDLATSSVNDANKAEVPLAGGAYWWDRRDWLTFGVSRWSFYHRELKHDVVRFYSDYLPAGHYHLSYVAQAIAAGQFAALSTKAEEMYDPDVYGMWIAEPVAVGSR